MINIVNMLITRRCNISCDYCRISGELNYITKPKDYPDAKYYYQNEKSVYDWMELARRMKKHNPDVFFIVYGGEPFLYKDLYTLINYLNVIDANYTIISNCTPEIQDTAVRMIERLGGVRGFTASVDPGFWISKEGDGLRDDEKYKSSHGFDFLKKLIDMKLVDDPVAEITVDANNTHLLLETLDRLSDAGIVGDITVLDLAKTDHYDFSNITNPINLVPKSPEIEKIFEDVINNPKYKIHMKETLLPKIYEMLPAELDCKLGPGNLHNITVDSDLSLRLCLRIRGRFITQYNAIDIIDNSGEETPQKRMVEEAIEADKMGLCKGCSWTCAIMSQLDINDVLTHG